MTEDRERLLDDIARVYARVAVDAWLLEQDAEMATPATSAKVAGVSSNGNSRNQDNAKSTRQRPTSASAP